MLTVYPACAGTTRRSRRMTCRNCGAHQTPQWRCGPEGPRTLCNACGVRYKKGLPLICTVPKGSLPPLPGALAEEPAVPKVPVPVEAQAVPECPCPWRPRQARRSLESPAVPRWRCPWPQSLPLPHSCPAQSPPSPWPLRPALRLCRKGHPAPV